VRTSYCSNDVLALAARSYRGARHSSDAVSDHRNESAQHLLQDLSRHELETEIIGVQRQLFAMSIL